MSDAAPRADTSGDSASSETGALSQVLNPTEEERLNPKEEERLLECIKLGQQRNMNRLEAEVSEVVYKVIKEVRRLEREYIEEMRKIAADRRGHIMDADLLTAIKATKSSLRGFNYQIQEKRRELKASLRNSSSFGKVRERLAGLRRRFRADLLEACVDAEPATIPMALSQVQARKRSTTWAC